MNMDNTTNINKSTHQLVERIKYLEEVNRSTLDVLDMMVNLGVNLSRNPLDLGPREIISQTKIHLDRIYSFHAMCFLMVDELDHDFKMVYCDPDTEKSNLQKEIDHTISDGNFAWALRHNKSVLIPSIVYQDKKVLLHTLSTQSRDVGMFIGFLSDQEISSGDISSDLFSIILYNSAQALENSILYKELKTSNKQLNEEIRERIQSEAYRRSLEHELMQQRRLSSIGLLTAGIAHNLRGPLSAMMGLIHLIQNDLSEPDDMDRMMQITQNMDDIISTMMVKSKRSQETEKLPIDINDLLSTELSFLEADHYFKHQIDKELIFEDNLPSVMGVYSDYSQGFMNIVQNAIHAMHESHEKKLTVKTWKNNNDIKVSITDTGCGIQEENIPHLFSPFFSTKPQAGTEEINGPTGTGLGLYSTFQLLNPYNVKIDIDSQAGKGTTFTFRIPSTENEYDVSAN